MNIDVGMSPGQGVDSFRRADQSNEFNPAGAPFLNNMDSGDRGTAGREHRVQNER